MVEVHDAGRVLNFAIRARGLLFDLADVVPQFEIASATSDVVFSLGSLVVGTLILAVLLGMSFLICPLSFVAHTQLNTELVYHAARAAQHVRQPAPRCKRIYKVSSREHLAALQSIKIPRNLPPPWLN